MKYVVKHKNDYVHFDGNKSVNRKIPASLPALREFATRLFWERLHGCIRRAPTRRAIPVGARLPRHLSVEALELCSFLLGFVRTIRLRVGSSEIEMHLRTVRGEAACRLKLENRSRSVPLFQKCTPQNVMVRGGLRREGNCFLGVRKRARRVV